MSVDTLAQRRGFTTDLLQAIEAGMVPDLEREAAALTAAQCMPLLLRSTRRRFWSLALAVKSACWSPKHDPAQPSRTPESKSFARATCLTASPGATLPQ
jgi:hypothetical protein